jgi:hypothetical protein
MMPRTLGGRGPVGAVRRPSFEMQQAALEAGYESVRDWVIDQCVEQILELKERVDDLEERPNAR